jgi:hypothetical protein
MHHGNSSIALIVGCRLNAEVAWQITYMLGSLFVPCQPTPVASLNTFYASFASDLLCARERFSLFAFRACEFVPAAATTHLVIFITVLMFSTLSITPTDSQSMMRKPVFAAGLTLIYINVIPSSRSKRSLGFGFAHAADWNQRIWHVCARCRMPMHPSLWYLPFFNYTRAPVKILIAHLLKTWPRTRDMGDYCCESFQFRCRYLHETSQMSN